MGKRKQADDFVMGKEACKLLNRSYSAVIYYIHTGRLPVTISPGTGFRMFRRSDVMKLAAELEGKGVSQ